MAQVVIEWPESQMLAEYNGFLENCTLINSDKGIEHYGSSAYLVEEDWYNQLQNGELEPITEEELSRIETDLQVDFGYTEDEWEDDEEE